MLKRILGGAILVVAITAAAFWLFQEDVENSEKPTEGVVVVRSSAVAGLPSPSPASTPKPPAIVSMPPGALVAHVRRAYPLLLDVNFGCDTRGCAITATIPPPTGEEFLRQRQEMLVGGLARLAEGEGYRMLGPVQMDEVDDNLFHIRASVVEAREPSK